MDIEQNLVRNIRMSLRTKKSFTVLLTCANSQVAPSVIHMIKQHPEYHIEVIGVDATDVHCGTGNHFCDHFRKVPRGKDQGYLSAIKSLVTERSVRLIFIGSDEEVLALSEEASWFNNHGCKLACSSHKVTCKATDKLELMLYLRRCGVPLCQFGSASTLSEIDKIVDKMGYPKHPVVIKPRIGRGSRGFRIIKPDSGDLYSNFLSSDTHTINIETLKSVFKNHIDKLQDYLLMEYLSGDKFSTDVLVSQGEVISMVTRNNGALPKTNPPTQIAEIVQHPLVEAYVTRIAESLPFDFFIQVETGLDCSGEPRLIEINVRLDATLPITEGVGLNFYKEMIDYAVTGYFNRSIVPQRTKTTFLRYWSHLFLG